MEPFQSCNRNFFRLRDRKNSHFGRASFKDRGNILGVQDPTLEVGYWQPVELEEEIFDPSVDLTLIPSEGDKEPSPNFMTPEQLEKITALVRAVRELSEKSDQSTLVS